MSNGKQLFSLEICYERNTTFWLGRSSQILLKLGILRLKQHGNLVALLFLQVGSFFRTIWGRMAVLSADSALDRYMGFCLERTCPSSMAFLLAILTIVIINSLYLKIIAVKQIFQLLILLSSEDLLKLIHSFLKLIVSISYDNYMQRFIVFEDIFMWFIRASAPHCYLAARSLLNQFLSLPAWTDNLTNIVCFCIVYCVLG